MMIARTPQFALSLRKSKKSDTRAQFGALCWRVEDGKLQVLLITSRETKRWIIPKGWPIHGCTPADSALTEAFEEAGVVGKVTDHCLGVFSYPKRLKTGKSTDCVVMVYPVRTKRLLKEYPEAGQRRRRWVGIKKAASLLSDKGLARIVRNFDPKSLA